jgi:hypothetical protein
MSRRLCSRTSLLRLPEAAGGLLLYVMQRLEVVSDLSVKAV